MKFDNTLMTFIQRDLESGSVPMLLGPPGIGKSSYVEALAELMHTKCFTLAVNQLADKADLTGGRLVPAGKDADGNETWGQEFFPHAKITEAIKYAKSNPKQTPILFLDELNRTTSDVTSAALSLPTLREIGTTKLPENLRIVVAGNDKGNVTSLDSASISRFVLYRVEPDTDTFIKLFDDLNVYVERTLRANPEFIFGTKMVTAVDTDDDDDKDTSFEEIFDDGEEMNQIATPRTIASISRWLNLFSDQELIEAFATITTNDKGEDVSAIQEAIEGHVGATPFAAKLREEIASGAVQNNNASVAKAVGKPQCYNELKTQTSIDDMNDFIGTMSPIDISGCIVYAIHEKADNATIIRQLAAAQDSLHADDMKTLTTLFSRGDFDEDNIEVLLSTKTDLSNAVQVVYSVFAVQ